MTNEQIKTLILLVIAFIAILAYAIQPTKWAFAGFPMEKLNIPFCSVSDSSASGADTAANAFAKNKPNVSNEHLQPTDTTSQTVLFIGDSMIEGLARRFAHYAEGNGHSLFAVVWYGSTTKSWAETSTLDHFIELRKPTFIVICLGSNELFVNDVERRQSYVATIKKKIGDIPYIWIGAPDWKGDTGINDMIQKEVGQSRYFDSRQLVIKRGKDNIHPTFSAASLWADSIAQWMSSTRTQHPIVMEQPSNSDAKCNFTLLQPNFEGY